MNAAGELGRRNSYFRDRILIKGSFDYNDYLGLKKTAYPALQGYCVDHGDPSIILPLQAPHAEYVWEDTNSTVTISFWGQIKVSKGIPQKVSAFREQQVQQAKTVLASRNQYFSDKILTKDSRDYDDYLNLIKTAYPALQGYCVDHGDPSIILPKWGAHAEFVWEDKNSTVTIAFGQMKVSKGIPQKVSAFRKQQEQQAKTVQAKPAPAKQNPPPSNIVPPKPAPKKPSTPPSKIAPRTISSGTGFAVSKHVIVTALHVVENRSKIKVCFDGRNWISAYLEKRSGSLDIAILKVDQELKNYLPLTAEETASAGDKVFTFGYPVVQLLGKEIKYSEGAISSMTGLEDDQTLMQTTVPIQPGNSGSPLFNEDGEVIGMLTSTAALPAFLKAGTIPQNINWAVKAGYISALMKHDHYSGKIVFKNRRDLMKAARQATCRIMAQ